MKYNSKNELTNAVETIAAKKIKYFYSDFTEYDLPKLKESFNDKNNNILYFLPRQCGSYLLSENDILENVSTLTIFEYFAPGNENTTYYKIDLKALSVTRMTPKVIMDHLKYFKSQNKAA